MFENSAAKTIGLTACSNNQLLKHLTVDILKIDVANTYAISNTIFGNDVKPCVLATCCSDMLQTKWFCNIFKHSVA